MLTIRRVGVVLSAAAAASAAPKIVSTKAVSVRAIASSSVTFYQKGFRKSAAAGTSKSRSTLSPSVGDSSSLDQAAAAAVPAQKLLADFLDVARKHPERMVLYKVGQFYEAYDDFAVRLSELFPLKLAFYGGKAEAGSVQHYMAGVPDSRINVWLPTFVRAGLSVVVVDQMDDSSAGSGKKRIRRDIAQIATPGTFALEEDLNATWLLAVARAPASAPATSHKNSNTTSSTTTSSTPANIGLCFVNSNTGEIVLSSSHSDRLGDELARLLPAEVLIQNPSPSGVAECRILQTDGVANPLGIAHDQPPAPTLAELGWDLSSGLEQYYVSCCPSAWASAETMPLELVQQLFGDSKVPDWLRALPPEQQAACFMACRYIKFTRVDNLPRLTKPGESKASEHLVMDATTLRSLELFEPAFSGNTSNNSSNSTNSSSSNRAKGATLFRVLSRSARTVEGRNELRQRMSRPSRNITEINHRLSLLDFFRTSHAKEPVQRLLAGCKPVLRLFQQLHSAVTSQNAVSMAINLRQIQQNLSHVHRVAIILQSELDLLIKQEQQQEQKKEQQGPCSTVSKIAALQEELRAVWPQPALWQLMDEVDKLVNENSDQQSALITTPQHVPKTQEMAAKKRKNAKQQPSSQQPQKQAQEELPASVIMVNSPPPFRSLLTPEHCPPLAVVEAKLRELNQKRVRVANEYYLQLRGRLYDSTERDSFKISLIFEAKGNSSSNGAENSADASIGVPVQGQWYIQAVKALRTVFEHEPRFQLCESKSSSTLRYTTDELRALQQQEDALLKEQAAIELENSLQLANKVQAELEKIKSAVQFMSNVDVACCTADVAHKASMVCPQVIPSDGGVTGAPSAAGASHHHHLHSNDNNSIITTTSNANTALCIVNGRHPVVSVVQKGVHFAPNSCLLTEAPFMFITGPNMGGKSTYMKMVAQLVILAHMGCFVPAESMRLSVVDRIFTRIGASDNLSENQSTFMMEMSETARVMNEATPHSLVIVDEIGRGTSHSDGMAIALAVIHNLVTSKRCRTLFATHYTSLGPLCVSSFAGRLSAQRFSAVVQNNSILFTHIIQPGIERESFGIEVARMARNPESVIHLAKLIKQELDSQSDKDGNLNLEQEKSDKIQSLLAEGFSRT